MVRAAASGEEPAAGQFRRQVKLGTEALYRVRGADGDHVEVEVVRAPGLRPGTRLRFTRAAVQRMECVEAPAAPSPRRPA